jgi:hypothetical protein
MDIDVGYRGRCWRRATRFTFILTLGKPDVLAHVFRGEEENLAQL